MRLPNARHFVPNSANGKVFLEPARLRDLMRARCARSGPVPPKLVAKLSPDIDMRCSAKLIEVLLEAKIDGIIVANTTIERPETLPGTPRCARPERPALFARSTAMLAQVAHLTGGAVPLIGVGGIASDPSV